MIHRSLVAAALLFFAMLSPALGQGSVDAARSVLTREMPHLAPQFHLSLASGEYAGKPDGFRISGEAGNIHVEAATVPTLLFGVNWYLKYVAHLNISTNGSRLGAPGLRLPAPGAPIVRRALYLYRYALNENTDGYTTPYWDLGRWQHEIDVLALSGFNAVLIQRGNDLAVYQAFLDMGYSDAEIRKWITYPAHQNWQWMDNMCCFDEPISRSLMEQRARSARQIIDLLRSLGMTPVLPGFYGVVPNDFERHVQGAHVVVQADKWNGFERPGWLDPRDPAFGKLAAAFYRHQEALFGKSTLYDMETFQEGGDAGDVPVGAGARAIQEALLHAHPDALWFMMAWQDNPKKELIDAVNRDHILIADIEQGRIPREDRDVEFQGARWLFGGLWEFGGRTTMGAPLYDYAHRMPLAAAKPGSRLAGTALFTEGLDTNPYAFDLYSEMAWRAEPVDLAEWTAEYARRRYGADDPHARKAWEILSRTAYGYRADGVTGHGERDAAADSVFNAQPSLSATRTGNWAPDGLRYDAGDLRPALTEMLLVAPALRGSASYRYDLTNLARQVLVNEARELLPKIRRAFDAKDKARLDALTGEWMRDQRLEDALLKTNENFLLGRWLAYLPAWEGAPGDAVRVNYDARSILTTWGDRAASEDLHEYGNKDWAGLVRDYYAVRWQMYFASLDDSLKSGAAPKAIDWYAFGDAWNRSTKQYDPNPEGDTYKESAEIARRLGIAPGIR